MDWWSDVGCLFITKLQWRENCSSQIIYTVYVDNQTVSNLYNCHGKQIWLNINIRLLSQMIRVTVAFIIFCNKVWLHYGMAQDTMEQDIKWFSWFLIILTQDIVCFVIFHSKCIEILPYHRNFTILKISNSFNTIFNRIQNITNDH